MKVIVLIENDGPKNLINEHGLSFYLETDNKKYLIDTGSSGDFVKNAESLNVDLKDIDMLFLSHSHYDHIGGLEEFFKINDKAKVYLQEAFKNKQCYKIIGPIKKYLGINKDVFKNNEKRFIYLKGNTKIAENIFVYQTLNENTLNRALRTNMYIKNKDGFFLDDFSHEMSVVFKEENDLYLFNSCSHSGVNDIVKEAKKLFPDNNIKAFFGGFHTKGKLGNSSSEYEKEEIEKIADDLLKDNKTIYYTGHCTGELVCSWLLKIDGKRFIKIKSGSIINL